jgi:hypothetical protein
MATCVDDERPVGSGKRVNEDVRLEFDGTFALRTSGYVIRRGFVCVGMVIKSGFEHGRILRQKMQETCREQNSKGERARQTDEGGL